ncbi:sugar ABC transporter permease [Jeotgalibacillus sp. S-D1]|uniref:carbohydrate ABC transporter permease n=1 Tax=Jeotgalibacillus sp. S-D1 TaxID=2552189 RepID=UPI00105963CB|nr:sugar ABC transporter permease [Jeotgalibacillus sp. S-D1]TDL33118.1 sugar ABC transporter permease [Jeotgalibacillus sp. S-D1]
MKKRQFKMKPSFAYFFLAPWIIGFLAFTAFPLVYSFYLSFHQVSLTTEGIRTSFVSLENFQYAFTVDGVFIGYLTVFFRELLLSVPIIIVFSLIIALLLNQKIRFRGLFRTIFFLPVIIASGPVLKELQDMGVTTIPSIEEVFIYNLASRNADQFLSGILLYVLDNIIMILWYSGVQILIFLAALQKIDRQIYEAAMIDGASTWEIFWKVTLPSIFPMIVVNTIYTIVAYSIFSLNPIIEHIKIQMFELETGFGYASALSWIYFVIIALILVLVFVIMNSQSKRRYA